MLGCLYERFGRKLQKIRPVVWLGDMNVIHQDLDIYNIKVKDT
jgi:exonuclease III